MRSLSVHIPGRTYTVTIGPGARRALRAHLDAPAGQQVVIADQTVADLHLAALRDALPPAPTVLTFPAGEASKSLAAVERLCVQLAAARVERRAIIIALGGGVAGDLAGFIAAVWLRGVRYIQVPTTLLAAVDASVGGKTGVNLAAGKNLVGAFHQPLAVVVDTEFLETLPERDWTAGLAESVKHAAIRDAEFLTWHEQEAARIRGREADCVTELIARNCEIKAAVVAADERETGLRAILNHGHTIGHAIEHVLGYELRHGECVALGMRVENDLARRRGLFPAEAAERIAALLTQLGLPESLPRRLDPAELWAVCEVDKKVQGSSVHFVLLEDVGRPVRVVDVTEAEVAGALETIQPR